LVNYFYKAFQNRFKEPCGAKNFKNDHAAMKVLLKDGRGISELKARIDKYINSDDEFITKAEHSLSLFKYKINTVGKITGENPHQRSTRLRQERKAAQKQETTNE
jgi:hypothetical protein